MIAAGRMETSLIVRFVSRVRARLGGTQIAERIYAAYHDSQFLSAYTVCMYRLRNAQAESIVGRMTRYRGSSIGIAALHQSIFLSMLSRLLRKVHAAIGNRMQKSSAVKMLHHTFSFASVFPLPSLGYVVVSAVVTRVSVLLLQGQHLTGMQWCREVFFLLGGGVGIVSRAPWQEVLHTSVMVRVWYLVNTSCKK